MARNLNKITSIRISLINARVRLRSAIQVSLFKFACNGSILHVNRALSFS